MLCNIACLVRDGEKEGETKGGSSVFREAGERGRREVEGDTEPT
jgi:hypothetical protein